MFYFKEIIFLSLFLPGVHDMFREVHQEGGGFIRGVLLQHMGLHRYVCMCVCILCMYVCMYVCMNVFMYVCMYVCIGLFTYVVVYTNPLTCEYVCIYCL